MVIVQYQSYVCKKKSMIITLNDGARIPAFGFGTCKISAPVGPRRDIIKI